MISPNDKEALEGGWYVDRKVYTSDEIFEQEKERIFYKTWHFACLRHDLEKPGDYVAMAVVDQPVLLVRGADDELRAFYNACTHRGAALNNKPCGNERLFKCMYHAWTFNLQGELIAVPYEQAYGSDFDKKQFSLQPVRVETFHDLVFVTLNPDAPSLIDYLGELAPHLAPYVQGIEVIGHNSWTYDGNWKLWHENFRDNYHPEFAHRAFHDAIPHYADRGGNWALSPGHSVLQWVSEAWNTKAYARGLERLTEVEFAEGKAYFGSPVEYEHIDAPQEVLAVFPNLDFQPGQQEGGRRGSRSGYIQTATPLGPHKARIDIWVYSSTDDDEETRKSMLENLADGQGSWGKISCDDTEAAVRCQIGLRGRGTQFTPFARGVKPGKGGPDVDGRDEYSLREFYRVYSQYLSAPTPVTVAAE